MINCPKCKSECDEDTFLGLCDKCLGIDDVGWKRKLGFTSMKPYTKPQLLMEEYKFIDSFSQL